MDSCSARRTFDKPSDIERITRSIGDARANSDFYVSHSTLADIESGAIPGIHKSFSLALAFKVQLNELLQPFGIDQGEIIASEIKPSPGVTSRTSSASYAGCNRQQTVFLREIRGSRISPLNNLLTMNQELCHFVYFLFRLSFL